MKFNRLQIQELIFVRDSKLTKDISKGLLECGSDGLFDTMNLVNRKYLMGGVYNIAQAAKVKSVTRQTIKAAISKGLLVQNDEGLIDTNNDVNKTYMMDVDLRTHTPVSSSDSGDSDDDPQLQKLKADIRLKTVTAQMKTLQYAREIGVLVDEKTIALKFGAFADFMFNELLTYPDNVSDIVLGIAKTSENPKQDIALELRDHLSHIIKRGKKIALGLEPPDSASYVFLEGED